MKWFRVEDGNPHFFGKYLVVCKNIDITQSDKPIKLVFEGPPIEDNGDMTFTIKRPMTLAEIAELFDMTLDELIHTKFGIYKLED